MRKLQTTAAEGDHDAAFAIEVFCLAIRKVVAAYTAVLGGLDLLIFAGGIGEHSALVRSGVCQGLGFLGIAIDEQQNQAKSANDFRPRQQGGRIYRRQSGGPADCAPLSRDDAGKS